MADRTIEYKVIIDTSTGKSSITDLNGNLVETDKLIKDIGKSTQENTQGRVANIRDMTVAFNGVKQAVEMVVGALAGMVKASEEARANENQLNLALKNVGVSGSEAAESIKKMAAQLQASGIAEGDAVIKTAALGLQMGITSENIKGATQAAYGLSKAYGIDVDSAIKLVANGLQGNFEQLGRLNPEMRAAKTESEKLAIFLKMVGDGYNFAKSEGDQFSGVLKRNANDLGDIKEELGTTIISLGGFAKYLDFSASFEYLKAGLASLVNAFVVAADGFTLPFVVLKDYAQVVFAGLKTAFTELISGNFSAALDAMKNIAVEGTNIVKREINEQIALNQQYAAIWDQAQQNIADKQKERQAEELAELKAQNDAKNAEAQKLAEAQAKKDDELFQEKMKLANEETARLKAEQDERIADNQAFLVKQQADQDAANDEMAMREIEAVWTVAEETKKAAKAKSDAEKKAQQDKAEYQKQGLKDSLNNLQALKTLGSDAAKIAKGAAVASATIDTIESAGKSYKWGASWGGPVGGAVMAAIAVAAGVARVAQITATGTGFQSGGYTGDVPENQQAGTVHGREFVMNAETTRRVGVSTLSAIQAGVPVSVLPSSQFAGSATSAGLNNVAGSVQALNMNMVNGAMPAPTIEINANTDLINFEIKRREASNEVDKTGRSFDNVS